MDRFQVTSRLTEFWIDAGKTATVTNIGSTIVYGSPDAPPTSTTTAAWSLAPGASRVEDVGAVWVLTANGTSSTLTVEPIASGLAVDTGTGVPSAVGSGGSGGAPSGAAGGDLGGTYPNPTVPGLALKEPILTPTAVKTANYALAAGELGLANAASPFTFTLPTAPADGARAGAKIVLPTSAPSTITVACGGTDTLNRTGGPTSLSLTLVGQAVTMQFVAGSPGYWVITDDDLPLSQLDLRFANLASPALTGTPTVPTAAVDTSTTQAASTAFVVAQAASSTPVVDGTGAAGTSTRFARADHVHPTDTSRAALASPTFTGTPAAPTATAKTGTTQLATTAYVDAADTTIAANTQTASYTLVLTDAGKAIEMNSASATVLTIPPNSSVAFPIGTVIEVVRIGAGSVTITDGAGVTIPNRLEAAGTTSRTLTSQYSSASLRKRATDVWVLVGDIA